MVILILGGVAWIVSGISFGKAFEQDSDRRRAMLLLFGIAVLGAFAFAAISGAGGGYSGPNTVVR